MYLQEAKEFTNIMNGYGRTNNSHPPMDRSTYMSPLVKMELPDNVDWREKGYVTEVRFYFIICSYLLIGPFTQYV